MDKLTTDVAKTAQNAQIAKYKMMSGIALGVIGGWASHEVSKLFDKKQDGLETEMIKDLKRLINKDENNSNIVSFGLS